jgi:hypothetical protein
VPLLVEEVITDNCGEVVDDDDALACVAEETIEVIDDVTLVVFFVDSSAPLSTILKNISNSLSSFLLLVSSKLLRTSSSFSKTAAFMTS